MIEMKGISKKFDQIQAVSKVSGERLWTGRHEWSGKKHVSQNDVRHPEGR